MIGNGERDPPAVVVETHSSSRDIKFSVVEEGGGRGKREGDFALTANYYCRAVAMIYPGGTLLLFLFPRAGKIQI